MELRAIQLSECAAMASADSASAQLSRLASGFPADDFVFAFHLFGGWTLAAGLLSSPAMGGPTYVCDLGDGDCDRAENMERGPPANKVGGTGAPAAASPDGGAAEPDQSTLPVQHAEFGLISGAHCSRYGARTDH